MKIAVTGASGFIGTELLAALNRNGDVSVIALTRNISGCEDAEHCEWRSTDYSEDSLKEVLRGVDAVIHLAGVRGTENDPDKFAINKQMTANVLNAMEYCGAQRIVFASTMSVYNDDELIPWKEEAPLKGRSCYGDSKAECEKLITDFAEKTGITYAIVRIAQVLGKGEKRRGMMNVFLETAHSHGTIRVMGKSIAKKQYIYVKDLVNILMILATGNDHFSNGENIIINAGMPRAYSNLEVAYIINEVYSNPTPVDYDDSYPESGRPFLMDIARLRTSLGYEPLDMKEAVTAFRDADDQPC